MYNVWKLFASITKNYVINKVKEKRKTIKKIFIKFQNNKMLDTYYLYLVKKNENDGFMSRQTYTTNNQSVIFQQNRTRLCSLTAYTLQPHNLQYTDIIMDCGGGYVSTFSPTSDVSITGLDSRRDVNNIRPREVSCERRAELVDTVDMDAS
ncbi:hypothetical protein QTP88_006012 [Uroleucon formosanum]